jgi:cytochrome c553
MQRPFLIKSILSISLLFSVSLSHAANTAPAEAAICSSCHGATGLGMANVAPMIAGLDKAYFMEQITRFKTGKRTNPTMVAMAMTIPNDKSSEVLAHYYSKLPTPSLSKIEQRGDNVIIKSPARKLVYQGDWTRNIPACSTCHGPSGLGIAHFPRLAGQHADYIKNQLTAWQNGTRHPDSDKIMSTIANKLTATEIDQLALYFSTVK